MPPPPSPPSLHLHCVVSCTPDNILLDDRSAAKIGDFGLARGNPLSTDGKKTHTKTHHLNGTNGYMSYEYLKDGVVSEKMDVYAFGVVLLELLTRQVAYDEKRREPSLSSTVEEGLEDLIKDSDTGVVLALTDAMLAQDPDWAVHTPLVLELWRIAGSCLETRYRKRPAFAREQHALLPRLSALLQQLPGERLPSLCVICINTKANVAGKSVPHPAALFLPL